jgi:hypothetical protein
MTTKAFDAVALMRELRDRLSQAMERMTPEERLNYVHGKATSTELGRKLAAAKRSSSARPERDSR